ncbi:MAG: TonB-dependent receptor [Gammaproteobacteria bacterium]|nr:TonB-dependent receptor [Gammaproteobacteria bacterium]
MSRAKGIAGLVAAGVVAIPVLVAVPRDGWAQVEEIIVTTRRREESLQDVPIAVQAIGSQQIERQNINRLEDIVKLSPSVQFDTSFSPADTRITIRGLSNTRGRSNVAFLIDGIDVTTENLITAGSGLLANRRLLNDVERIELVKGPQSALYGRAAFSGAISYVTKEPGPEFEGKVGLDFAEEGQKQADWSFGGPIPGLEDVLGARISGVVWDEKGRYVNSISGERVGGTEGAGGALTVVYTPADTIKFKLRAEFTDEQFEPRPNVRVGGGLPLELKPTPDGSQNNMWPSFIDGTGQRITIDDNGDGLPDVDPNNYTCQPGNQFILFPKTALDADFGVGTAFGFSQTGLADFGPGFCVPETYGDAKGRVITHSEDPFTGKDYPGTDQQTFRAALSADFDVGVGAITTATGFTDFDATDSFDQDYQASGRPDTLFAAQQADTATDTQQFSQEIRFRSDLEGPLQFTIGGLYWEEKRKLQDKNWIIFCAPVAKAGGRYGVPQNGPAERVVCNGQNGTVDNWQQFARSLPVSAQTNASQGLPAVADDDIRGAFWQADTEHWSIYGMLEWEFAERWRLTLENRYVNEDFRLFKPNQSSCTTFGAAPLRFVGNNLPEEVITNDPARQDVVCESEQVLNDGIFNLPPEFMGPDWDYTQGSESSRFNTPKVTLEWTPSDDSLVYFYWANAQKPGGINQLIAGGFPVPSIDFDRFEPEKLDAWEVGTKNTWEVVGFLQLNGAFFFQDYTDKQVTTQIEINNTLTPVVLNASGAEVWGLELDATWVPSFLPGLTLSAGWTWLDAEYTDFIVESANLVRAANNSECNVVTITNPDGSTRLACRFDLAGNKLERTPEHSVVLQGNFTRPLGSSDIEWFIEGNAAWQDERFPDEDNVAKFEAYWLVDLRLGLIGENWQALAYVDNLLDDDTIRTGGPGPDFGQQVTETGFTAGFGVTHFFGTLPRPRTLGLRVSYRF